jgi:glycosyltransferase involved in cell wall biosynthesis
MKISYAITVYNECNEINRLINFLLEHKRLDDNIVVLFDDTNGTLDVENLLNMYTIGSEINYYRSSFNKDFAEWKNKLTSYCDGDYIFQIDADEVPNVFLVKELHNILMQEESPEVILVPRVNTVEGITDDHINAWGWNVNKAGWVNWPDYQWRIYKNTDSIKWKNKVHEVLDGFKTYAAFPAEEAYCLYHPKTIERQEKQNNFYGTL